MGKRLLSIVDKDAQHCVLFRPLARPAQAI